MHGPATAPDHARELLASLAELGERLTAGRPWVEDADWATQRLAEMLGVTVLAWPDPGAPRHEDDGELVRVARSGAGTGRQAERLVLPLAGRGGVRGSLVLVGPPAALGLARAERAFLTTVADLLGLALESELGSAGGRR